jgi:hypothetical protein
VPTLLKLLTLIASLGPKIPKAIELINALIALFAPEIASAGELKIVRLSAKERRLVEKISAGLSTRRTQALFDVSKLSAFAKWLAKSANSELGKLLIAILTRAVAGG